MFEVFEHTADLGLRIRASIFRLCFPRPACFFAAIVEDLDAIQLQQAIDIRLNTEEPAFLLLFDWLRELLYQFDVHHLVFSRFDVKFGEDGLVGHVEGEPFDPSRHIPLHRWAGRRGSPAARARRRESPWGSRLWRLPRGSQASRRTARIPRRGAARPAPSAPWRGRRRPPRPGGRGRSLPGQTRPRRRLLQAAVFGGRLEEPGLAPLREGVSYALPPRWLGSLSSSASSQRCPGVSTSASASARSRTVWKRAAGSRCVARANQASKPGGTSATDDGTGMGSAQICSTSSPTSSASKGTRPVRHSNAITASDQRSIAPSSVFAAIYRAPASRSWCATISPASPARSARTSSPRARRSLALSRAAAGARARQHRLPRRSRDAADPLPRLAGQLGGGELLVKDEGRLPTGSFKARGLALAVSMAKELGVTQHGDADQRQCRRGDGRLLRARRHQGHVFCPDDTPEVNVREIAMQGAGSSSSTA